MASYISLFLLLVLYGKNKQELFVLSRHRFKNQVRFFKDQLLFPRKLYTVQHTPISHTRSAIPRSPIMKGIPAYSLLVKVARGVFQFGVLKQP